MAEILVIEDDLGLGKQIQRFLEEKGHGVCFCADGSEGWNTLREVPFDVIVMDVKLPGMLGTEILKHAKTDLPCHPPFILITGHGDKDTAIKAVHFGAFDFIEKPFSPVILEAAISRALLEHGQAVLAYRTFLSQTQSGELTARESEVALLAAEGLSNDIIAKRLSLGSETVKSHLKKIFRKLGVANRAALSAKLKR